MKLTSDQIRYCLLLIAVVCVLAGSFSAGMGMVKVLSNETIRREYAGSELEWKQELMAGEDNAAVRDLRNQELAENMKYVSIEHEIYFETSEALGEARIGNAEENVFGCKVSIIRDATGEVVYESDLIVPGYYIEEIGLAGRLKAGYYPCTAVWSFYTQGEEYAGETAEKLVIIINTEK